MKRVRITVKKKATYQDLIDLYENRIKDPCPIALGSVFISENANKPAGLCDSAWETLSPFVKTLAEGGGDFYGEWMKDRHSAMVSCNDGFRPVSFLLETID